MDDYWQKVRQLPVGRSRLRGGALALVLLAGACMGRSPAREAEPALRTPSASPVESTEQESPGWLDERAADGNEAGRGKRHRDEEGRVKSAKARNRFGLEGAQDENEPHMSREQAREAAKNAGVVGILRATPEKLPARPSTSSPLADDWNNSALGVLGNDPTSGLRLHAENAVRGMLGLAGAGPHPLARRDARENAHKEAHPLWKRGGPRAQSTPPTAARDAARRPASALRAHPKQLPASALDDTSPGPAPEVPTHAAQELLARYSTREGVQPIDANGYFANTYVPGDPELRSLQARLAGYPRASLLPKSLVSAHFDEASQRVLQPFDPPEQAALALYVAASESGITSARRMLLQVGLQATPRYSGRRPAMNVGIVVDAREPLDAAALEHVRTLLSAFAAARDPNDKLSLFAAGPAGGALVTGEAFRHGPLSVALQRVQTERSGISVSLPDALQAALQQVRGGGDPVSPLGSSVAIVVAPRSLGAELARLEAIAHESAVAGVPVSAFGVGTGADADQLSRLALAGQGNRRMLSAPDDAAQAAERELSAVARVVARAVRLRIRLATGVRLLSVLGSQPLDPPEAASVRQAESSIDQRVRKDLGIAQDRGEDEEGVQIVIPSFYAGDSHVVLLDVVAEGPGAVADITVRYKDLVQLGNASMRESLWLSNVELARGALQRNVLKNLVAFELAQRLRSAGDALAQANTGLARQELDRTLALLDTLVAAVPEWSGDREVEADRALTAEYLSLLAHADQPARREFAADSLRFASLLKLQPRPEADALPREAGQVR